MKPPAAGAKAAVTSSSSRQGGGSHIPLPLRKGSTKLDKTQDGENECGEDCDRPKASRGRRGNQERSSSSGGKMSLLGGTSFCCASGQKDDIRDSQSIPAPQKRRMKNSVVKREAEGNAADSAATTPPVIAKKLATPKSRRPKIENDTVDDSLSKDSRQNAEEFGCKSRASVEEKIPSRSLASSHPPLQDNRLKFSDTTEKRRSSTTTHPRTKDVCSSAGQRKDSGNEPEMTAAGKQQKYTEVLRKLRKDPAHCTPNNIMVLNVENKLYEKNVTNDKKVNEPAVEISHVGDAADSNDRLKSISEDNQTGFNVQKVGDHSVLSSGMILKESMEDRSLSPGHVDDLNCPCCDNSDIASSEILGECTSADCVIKDVLDKDLQQVSMNSSLKDCKENNETVGTETLQLKKVDKEKVTFENLHGGVRTCKSETNAVIEFLGLLKALCGGGGRIQKKEHIDNKTETQLFRWQHASTTLAERINNFGRTRQQVGRTHQQVDAFCQRNNCVSVLLSMCSMSEEVKGVIQEDAEDEVGALKEELKQEKLRLQNQQERVLQLEEEVKVMQQLKRELSKEQRLRKEAEETLLEILNRGSNLDQDQQRLLQLESQDCATECKKHESGRTAPVPDTDEDNSSLLLGYESRIRRYQLYISKLEKDNLTLIRELQQFKDLSPCSQQEQAKALLGKVTQLERDNQQQQVQYECCLDEVANRLVHTLLAQKHLEEECNTLHARVEQLENENQKLLAIVHGDEEKVKTLRASSQCDPPNVSERSSSDCSPKESLGRLLDAKKSTVREPVKYVGAKHVKTCKVPPTRHQKTLIPEDRVSSINFNALSASKIASSFDKAGFKAHHIHPRILNNQIPSQVNENFRQISSDASVCPIQKSVTKATTKCSSPNSVPNSSRLRSPTIHLSFTDKASSATDDARLSDVTRKRLNRVTSEKEVKELQLHGRYPNTSLGKCLRPERNYLHSESSIHLETALQPHQNNALLMDESFSDSDDVFVYTDSPKNISYDAFSVLPLSRDQQGIYLEDSSGKVFSPVHETDNSVSNDTVHRTRDEGYSTMSSDLQPDSAADTTVSEQDDHSATYIVSESGQRCSDDSITECLDGSMSSSSDSGFGPLHCVTGDLLSTRFPNASLKSENQFNSENSSACVLVNGCSNVQAVNHEVELQDGQKQSTPEPQNQEVSTIIPNGVDRHSSQELSVKDSHQSLDVSTQSCDSNQRHSTETEISDFCEDSSNSEATTIIPPHKILKTSQDFQSISCHVNEIIDPPLYSELSESQARSECDFPPCYPLENVSSSNEEKTVLTAEKATLTEPEELMWREKALAQYIDESIWSLYSSESDIQIKYSPETFHNQPLEEIPSRPHGIPRSKTHNCITLSEDLEVNSSSKNSPSDIEVTNMLKGNPVIISADNAMIELFNNNVYDDSKVSVSQHSLERVASDTVLHLKTTFHELETSMKSSLKTSKDIANKNIPLVHHLSVSDISNRDLSLTPDRDIQLETKFLEKAQKKELTVSNLWWPSPTDIIKSSSLSSLQSSLSYQAVSDEMEDDDVHHISRKGSQDPDLSSASDTDYVNLDHKDFVEQWLQKEITEKHASTNEEGCTSDNTRKTTVLRKNVPRYYMKKSPRNFSSNQNESNGVPLDHRPQPEDGQCLREMLSESQDAHVRLHSSSLETTPNSLENYYMGEISALYADACASYVEDNYQSKGFAVSSEIHYPPYSLKNLSPGMYKNLDTENVCDEYLQCPPSEDCDSQSLEPEVKAFNSDFYRLCNLGSLRSLDSYSVGKTDGSVNQDLFQKQLLLSPKFARFNLRKTQELVNNQKASSKIPENNCTQSEQAQPVRPTSFTSPLVPCDRKFHSFSNKDSNCQKCDATGVPETARVFQCSLHPGSQCNCERKSAHLPCSDDSLPAKKPVVNANNTEVHSKLPIRKVSSSNKTHYSGDRQGAHVLVSPKKKVGNSPQHRIASRDLLLDYRTDEVSKRQQSRRERWNARRNRMKEGCGTAWIHLQTSSDFADPNMRESLLDSVVATSSSDSSSSEDENEYLLSHNTSQLQRICQEKRQKAKAPGKGNNLGLLPRRRTSILNCSDLYYRYGQQEQEAIACFDFLEDIPTASESGSLEILQKQAPYNANTVQYNQSLGAKGRLKASVYDDLPSTNCSLPSKPSQFLNFSSRLRLPALWNKPLSHNMSSMTVSSQDCEFLDHISLSDSCAESYSSTPDSFEDTSAS